VISCSINNGEAGDNDGVVVGNDNGAGDRDEVDDKDD
jgi:hypothetical protein